MPTLEHKQAAMCIRAGRAANDFDQGRLFLTMWLLLRNQRSMTPSKLAKRYDLPKAWVERWIDAGCPLDGT
jgi:hypothetical protein